jgi:uncharacterized membrane protein
MIAGLKTFCAYFMFYSVVSAGWVILLQSYNDFAVGIATVVSFIGTLALYFGRRIPRWTKKRQEISR